MRRQGTKGPYIIVRRGRRRKAGSSPEAVIDDLKRMKTAHNQEYREDRERRLADAGDDYEERLRAAQAARAKQAEVRDEATHRLDEHDW